MENKKRNQIIIAISALVVLILLIILVVAFFLFDRKKSTSETVLEPVDTAKIVKEASLVESENIVVGKSVPEVSLIKNVFTEKDLILIAINFAERFGSYSNQANYENMITLQPFMSERMKNWSIKYVDEQRQKNVNNSIYYGIITKVVSSEVEEFNDEKGNAKVSVKTRRKESFITGNNSSQAYNQGILLTMVKENGTWKIDEAYWQEKE